MNNLDNRYFNKINVKDGYEIIKCKETTQLVLFSKINGLPLASICLKCQDNIYKKNKRNSLISHLPSDKHNRQKVLGLINMDNQEFELVITNLLPGDYFGKKDYINFNILKTDKEVTETNPKGLNEINELRPNESYAVKSDFTEENKRLILSSLKEEEDGIQLTVKEDEENSNKRGIKTKGTYLYLSVVPQIDSEYSHLFKDTVWKSTEYFVRKSCSSFTERSILNDYSFGDNDEEYNEEEESNYDFFESFNNLPLKSKMNMNTKKSKLKNVRLPNNSISSLNQDIYNSQASKIKLGDKINVNSSTTNIRYKFDNPSNPCIMGLSVMSNLKFNYEMDNSTINDLGMSLLEDLKIYDKEMEKNKYLNFIETKIYKQNTCCICMMDKPDTIFYSCGHKAVKYECLTKDLNYCPLCRTIITAYLKVDNNSEDNISNVDKNVINRTKVLY